LSAAVQQQQQQQQQTCNRLQPQTNCMIRIISSTAVFMSSVDLQSLPTLGHPALGPQLRRDHTGQALCQDHLLPSCLLYLYQTGCTGRCSTASSAPGTGPYGPAHPADTSRPFHALFLRLQL
jgi:hypothetical protein